MVLEFNFKRVTKKIIKLDLCNLVNNPTTFLQQKLDSCFPVTFYSLSLCLPLLD